MPGFVIGQFFAQETLSMTAAGWFSSVNAKVLCNIILVDLVTEDQGPFAECLGGHQQDQYYRDGIFQLAGCFNDCPLFLCILVLSRPKLQVSL